MIHLKFWFPVGVYSGIIFYLSGRTGEEVYIPFSLWDKPAHVLEYAVLAVLVAPAIISTTRWNIGQVLLSTVGYCTAFGLLDEFHQSFVPGREVSLGDAFADLLGAFIGAGLYLLIFKHVMKRNAHVSH